MKISLCVAGCCLFVLSFVSCSHENRSNKEMVDMLATIARSEYTASNAFCPEAKLSYFDSLLRHAVNAADSHFLEFSITRTLLELGEEEKAMQISDRLVRNIPIYELSHLQAVTKDIAIASLRIGERKNCIKNHTGESCVFPIAGGGIHADRSGSLRAIETYEKLLSYEPNDLESRWLLNIAYMTIGGYPQGVPDKFLIKGLDADTAYTVKPFVDIAARVGLNTNNMAGGSIVDDFNNDGYFDLITSSWGLDQGMHYSRNNGNGTFTDLSVVSGLRALTGGLNIVQTDYNNDGLKDIFVLRGAWKDKYGKEPNSLLKNNGDGTFEEVSASMGLNRVVFAMGANFGDIDNDGYLDMYFGTGNPLYQSLVPNKMFRNLGGSQFVDITTAARVGNLQKGHGVSFADLDNDGDEDVYIDMGGAYIGDSYESSLYLNPGQNNNRWINITLEGVTGNRAAIGAKVKVTFKENGKERSVYRDVNSGGSFGSNPLTQHIGIGQAAIVQSVEVKWPVSGKVQVFKDIRPGDDIAIREGNNTFVKRAINRVDFTLAGNRVVGCSPL